MAGHRKLGSRWCAVAAVVVLAAGATGCLRVDDRSDSSPSRRTLAETVAGEGITRVSNVETAGRGRSMGLFADGTRPFGLDHGVVLSTGRADAVLPSSTPVARSTDNDSAGDADADSELSWGDSAPQTVDASTLEFDFVPTGDWVRFSYVVASDDARAGTSDIAHLRVNGEYYCPIGRNTVATPLSAQPAPPPGSTALDRVSKLETCRMKVVPGEVNHFKATVADEGDGSLDTVLLLGTGSLVVEPKASFTVHIDPVVHVNGTTGRATVTGTFTDCSRVFDVVADPDIELEQPWLDPRPQEYGHIPITRCQPDATVPWSAQVPNGAGGTPSPPFAAGPGVVIPHFATYETNGDESNGHEHGTTPVTVVIDPPA